MEKPDLEKAKQYLARGDYYWNAGIFVAAPGTILREIELHLPGLHQGLGRLRRVLGTDGFGPEMEKVYPTLESISFDYGIMERTTSPVMVVPCDCGWSDVGSWSSLHEVRKGDQDMERNMAEGDTLLIDCEGNYVSSGGGRLVTCLGLRDCLVVDTLPPSSIIFLPPVAATGTSTPVATQQVCGPPTNWVPYLVQLNDSLLKISLMFNISVPELQLANCMGDSTTIYVGTYIMVPFLPTKTFTPTFTPTYTAETLPPQFTNTPVFTLTLTPTTENTPTWTYTPTHVLTVTPSETLTPLPTNTETIQPTPTENPIVTPEG